MHEYGMCDGIVDAIQRRAAGRRVARVKVRVGVMHRIVEEAFQHAFAHGSGYFHQWAIAQFDLCVAGGAQEGALDHRILR